jgi:hypothetical protein
MSHSTHGGTDHKAKADHDLKTAELLLAEGNHPDWVVTCSFYTALHCVDAYAHKLGITSFDPKPEEKLTAHSKRERFVKNNMQTYFGYYKWLHDRSTQARYDPQYFKLMFANVPSSAVKDAKIFVGLK